MERKYKMYRLIIADDEVIECKGLERMIQIYFPNIMVLKSVSNGIELIESIRSERPDIAIVDINMPGLNGLDAISMLRMESVKIKVIINSAYSKYEYMRKAMILGASDFLQKPMEEYKFRETLGRVLHTLDEEKIQEKNIETSVTNLNNLRKLAESEIMSSIILGRPDEQELNILFENLQGDYFGGIIVALTLPGNFGKEVLLIQIQKDLESFIHKYCTCMMKIHKNVLYLFLIPGATVNMGNYLEWVKELTEKIVKRYQNSQLKLGISRWKYEFEKMPEALREAENVVHEMSKAGISFYKEVEKSEENTSNIVQIEKITEEFFKGNRKSLKEQIQAITDQYQDDRKKICVMQLLFYKMLENYQDKYLNAKKIIDLKSTWINLEMCENIDELIDVTENILEQKIEEKQEDLRDQYVKKAVLYMEENYMKDISLDQVADAVKISSFYLSRILKHQLNKNFIDLLTDIRIEQSIKLIGNNDFTVRDIGTRVGYPSQTYFYKVFKRKTGMTVGEMREFFRSIEENFCESHDE